MTNKLDDLKQQNEQLEIEARIASTRADIVEANVRRIKSQMEYSKLRASLANAKK